jgi:GT2 family glycosyltransferase
VTNRARVAVVIPVLDQLEVTLECLARVARPDIGPPDRIVVVDNGSSPPTATALRDRPGITLVRNDGNRGCAAAWNQGVAAGDAEWIVVLNNDVLVTPGWIDGLLAIGRATGASIVSPAIREGPLNYDLDSYAREFTGALAGAVRRGVADGIAFMVHRSTFDAIGTFDEAFRVGQYEDADFYRAGADQGFDFQGPAG